MNELTAADAAHLMRRAAFGGTPAEIDQLVGVTREQAVDQVLDVSAAPLDRIPAAIEDPRAPDTWGAHWAAVVPLLDRAARTPAPLLEKMTFVWHNHFTSGTPKTTPALLYRQLATYRRLALGDYRQLAQAMAVEPAMLLYLDTDSSTAHHPNLNFGRELLELFLLGVGNYTEADIATVARAWTGHHVDRTTMQHRFDPANHAVEPGSFLGRTRHWDGPDIIDAVFADEASAIVAARHLCRRLWRTFVHPSPPEVAIDQLAHRCVAAGWQITAVVREVLLRDEFWSPDARRALVRSPIDTFVALLRLLDVSASDAHPEWWLPRFEQVPLSPPDVSGWKSDTAWISPHASAVRADLAAHISFGLMNLDRHPFLDSPTLPVDAAVDRVLRFFGIVDASPGTVETLRAFVADLRVSADASGEGHLLLVLALLTPDFALA